MNKVLFWLLLWLSRVLISTFFVQSHYNDVIVSAMASQITSLTIFIQPLIQAQIKENIKVLRHWSLCGEFTGDRWIPGTMGQ